MSVSCEDMNKDVGTSQGMCVFCRVPSSQPCFADSSLCKRQYPEGRVRGADSRVNALHIPEGCLALCERAYV